MSNDYTANTADAAADATRFDEAGELPSSETAPNVERITTDAMAADGGDEQTAWFDRKIVPAILTLSAHPSKSERKRWHASAANIVAIRQTAEERGHLAVMVQLVLMFLGFRMEGDTDDERMAAFKDLVSEVGLTATKSKWPAANAVIYTNKIDMSLTDTVLKKQRRNEIERFAAAIKGLDLLVCAKEAEGFVLTYDVGVVKELVALVKLHGITWLGELARNADRGVETPKYFFNLIQLDGAGIDNVILRRITEPYGGAMPSVGLIVDEDGKSRVVSQLPISQDRILALLTETAVPEPRIGLLSEVSRLALAVNVYPTDVLVNGGDNGDDPDDEDSPRRPARRAWWLRSDNRLVVTQFLRLMGHTILEVIPHTNVLSTPLTEDLWFRTHELEVVTANLGAPGGRWSFRQKSPMPGPSG